jgi:hypothetical protein
MIVTSFTKAPKPGVFIGHFKILYLTEFGLCWEELKLFMKNGHRWIAPHSKCLRDPAGNTNYEAVKGFENRSDFEKWQKAILTALDKFCANGEGAIGQISQIQTSDERYPLPYKDD